MKSALSAYLNDWLPSITVLTGTAAGTEIRLDQARVLIGRGPGVDFAFDDPEMSTAHALIEFVDSRFRLRRLNGECVLLNGGDVADGELKHGDWFALGAHRFEFSEVERPLA